MFLFFMFLFFILYQLGQKNETFWHKPELFMQGTMSLAYVKSDLVELKIKKTFYAVTEGLEATFYSVIDRYRSPRVCQSDC